MRMRLDIWFIALALLLMLASASLSEMMRAHVNVSAWAAFALFGLIHRAYPALEESPLALPQFLIATVSAVFFVGGIWAIWALGDTLAFVAGGYGLIASIALFIVMFFQRIVFAHATHPTHPTPA